MTSRAGMSVRGVLLGFFATLVAALSHSLAGGTIASIAGLCLALVFSTLVCVALAGRALSLWRTAASVAASQLLFHGLFGGIVGSSAIVTSPSHHHGQLPSLAPTAGMHAVHESPSMWAAHLAAALVTLLSARKGEQAIAGLALLVALVVRPLLASFAPPVADPSAVRMRMPASPRDVALRMSALISPMRHRGPPELQFV